jgi:hypothetical protein
MGMYIDYQGAIRVMVPRDLHIGEVEFNDLVKVGDTVRVEIKKSRYQVNDTSILSVGIFKGRVKAGGPEAEEKKEDFTEVVEEGDDEEDDAADAEAAAIATAQEEDEEDTEVSAEEEDIEEETE